MKLHRVLSRSDIGYNVMVLFSMLVLAGGLIYADEQFWGGILVGLALVYSSTDLISARRHRERV